ncbi:MAG TPA: hypothetical protein EYN89_05995 [Flavobacteriales bacterium]|nr:hypothetical protein [Flavobacteriales bacterium]
MRIYLLIHYNLGICYLRSKKDLGKAIGYLEKAIEHISKKHNAFAYEERNAPISAHFELGKAYQLTNKLDEATSQFRKCIALLPKRNLLQEELSRHIEMCEFAKSQMANRLNVKISNLGEKINSTYSDFGPILNTDESIMAFTSNRLGSTGQEIAKNGNYYNDIYISNSDGHFWSDPQNINGKINSKFNDVAAGLSSDGQQLFLFNDQTGYSYLYQSNFFNGEWSPIEFINENMKDSSLESHSSISLDGSLLYFASSREGGYGGTDIYRCRKLPNGAWAKAENLGPKINTKHDEISPYIHPNGSILFFSSKGHQNLGGFDIFSSEIDENQELATPKNIGYPVNTTGDESYYVLNAEGRRAYFSSTKPGGLGNEDIYVAEFFDYEKIAVTILKGTITIKDQGDSEAQAEILVYDNADLSSPPGIFKPNSSTGKYVIVLKPGRDYKIEYLLNDLIVKTDHIFVLEESVYQEIEKSVIMEPIELDAE